ncbi:carboxypeptidase Y, partial [Coprinopsis sp. MPI-PUGE-AT-0042]
YDNGLFTPIETLSKLSEVHYTTLDHPAFPRHSVRIKQTKFCDGTVRAYTGYIDVGVRHLFFYFFESRSNPAKDDVILWTNGGPGCSSSLGLFMELGPCRINDANGTKWHRQSWNDKANIFFIDQPVGVGFSYAENGEAVSTTEQGAEDIANFIFVFFEHFTDFKGRNLHLAGESYAGRYLPLFASYIYDQNAKLRESGVMPVNLASVMIGNGYTHHPTMVDSYYDMACTGVSVEPRLGIRECVRMKQAQIRCREWLQKSCQDKYDALACQAATDFCTTELGDPIFASGWNPYDLGRKCDGSVETTLCYPVTKHIANYLDRPDIRSLLSVDPILSSTNFSSCSTKVGLDFASSHDEIQSDTHLHVASLLEHGVKVLIYVGKNDWICNHVGNKKWVHELDWSGKHGFGKAEMRRFVVDSIGHGPGHEETWGDAKSFGGLTFLTIDGAGHMAPYDKPDGLLWMVNRWMEG